MDGRTRHGLRLEIIRRSKWTIEFDVCRITTEKAVIDFVELGMTCSVITSVVTTEKLFALMDGLVSTVRNVSFNPFVLANSNRSLESS